MLSPTWLFGVPAVAALTVGIMLFAMAIIQAFAPGSFPAVGNYWVVLAAALLSGGHLSAVLAFAGKLYGLRAGYRVARPWEIFMGERLSLEAMLIVGFVFAALGERHCSLFFGSGQREILARSIVSCLRLSERA
ncbi:hypothetical protein ACFSUK_08660 [Sphingobium scionense]